MRRWYLIVAMIAGSVMADWTIDPKGLPTGDFIAIRVDTICDTFVGGGIGDCFYDTMVWADGAWRELSPPDTLMPKGGQRFAKKPVPQVVNLFPTTFPLGVYVLEEHTLRPMLAKVYICELGADTTEPKTVAIGMTNNLGRAWFDLPKTNRGYAYFCDLPTGSTGFGAIHFRRSAGIDTIFVSKQERR